MNNNKLVEYKEDFISKIKKFFKRIFDKNIEHDDCVSKDYTVELEKDNNLKNDITNNSKATVKTTNITNKRNEFLKEIEGNEDALRMLSIDRLKRLEKYYDNIIEQNNEKIKRLKKTI